MLLLIRRPSYLLAVLVAACMSLSCAGGAKPTPGNPPEGAPTGVPPGDKAPPADSFDPAGVTAEVKTATFVDVRALIDTLNEIIRRQDYEAWKLRLSEDYVRYNSDPATLAKIYEYPIIKRKGIKLKTLNDYFVYVVYPSRQNDKVDDIEFVDAKLIKAITINSKGDRNILYMLEKHGDTWKIGIGR